MTQKDKSSMFKAKLHRPAKSESDNPWGFVILPKNISETLPRRGGTTVVGTINKHVFQATLEPDGQLSHWLKVDNELLKAAGLNIGEMATLVIAPVEQEPEPEVPSDLRKALACSPEALIAWDDISTIARVDWIHWITTAKQAKTRTLRINNTCDMLASGKRRVCCFDPSGFYSKALNAPKAID